MFDGAPGPSARYGSGERSVRPPQGSANSTTMEPRTAGRRILRAAEAAALAGLVAYALISALAENGGGLDTFAQGWLYNALMLAAAGLCLSRAVLVRAERYAWLAMGLGVAAWSAGEIYYAVHLAGLEEPPYPSLSDAFYLLFYPALYVGLVLLVRARVRKLQASLWLDGVIGALAVAAFGAAVLLEPVLESTGGDAMTVAADLAYPLGDVLLLAFAAGVFALTGWRPGRGWALIGAGIVAAAVADGLFLYQVANGTYVEGSILEALWPASVLLLGYAAWQPSRHRSAIRLEGWRMLVFPSIFALSALGLLVYENFGVVNRVAVVLAAATLVAVIARTAMTFGENLRMLSESRREAMTDSLTGLSNRRQLMLDLKDELRVASYEHPRVLVLFDLDGFKRYNDTYGHPAGDALLARLGRHLEDVMRPYGRAYRLGGDEFCALITDLGPGIPTVVALAAAALSEQGKGFDIRTSYGTVALPREAEDATRALQTADQRLYARKGGRRRSAVTQQTRDVLLQVLREREPELRDHLDGVAHLAAAVGRRLGLLPERLDEVARAAELHDIGKMAVPEALLQKPGPLDHLEWSIMREHTVIGERMLGAAPALAPVAKIVRSSHERYDGRGYPDGLAGDQIPLGARIIAVCDAFEAMVSDRCYAPGIGMDAALDELRRCAGNQFDPKVVEAFCAEISESPESLLHLRLDQHGQDAPDEGPDLGQPLEDLSSSARSNGAVNMARRPSDVCGQSASGRSQ